MLRAVMGFRETKKIIVNLIYYWAAKVLTLSGRVKPDNHIMKRNRKVSDQNI